MSKFLPHTVMVLALSTIVSCHSPKEPQADANTCAALAKQFDDALATHGDAAKLDKAKSRRAEGAQKCDAADFEGGVKALRSALKKLGVTPTAEPR